MKLNEILNLRLSNQLLTTHQYKNPKDIVSTMGAMQAQDYQMAKWGIGTRLKGSDDETIESAYNKGDILRTHLMRPTWHFVSSDDIFWMLELTAPQISKENRTRQKQLELNNDILFKCFRLIEKAFSKKEFYTRDELTRILNKHHIRTDENRASHIYMAAELDCLLCSGENINGKLTYALFYDRVKKINSISKDEALSRLACKYFNSHSPATLKDFIWWSGLSVNDAKRAVDICSLDLISENIDSVKYFIFKKNYDSAILKNSVFLLPAYDEFLISYADRKLLFADGNYNKAVSNNGIFRPVIINNGIVSGIWKRVSKKDKISIETEPFRKHTKKELSLKEKKTKEYLKFLGK